MISKIGIVNRDDCLANGRIKYIPDDSGEYYPYELTCFSKSVYVTADLEKPRTIKHAGFCDFILDEVEEPVKVRDEAENRRKSYNRAKNNLFDLLMCTTEFDCFITLTLDGSKIDRYSYDEAVKALGVWLDNRVRRKGLKYVLVPEFHKDGAVHFHGLFNFNSLKAVRAVSPYSGLPMSDDSGRPIYNISDYKLGFSTAIPLSGKNARVATAKYCYKYITKSKGCKVGGRYYLSGGKLGRPRYSFVNIDYNSVDCAEINIKNANMCMKKLKL